MHAIVSPARQVDPLRVALVVVTILGWVVTIVMYAGRQI